MGYQGGGQYEGMESKGKLPKTAWEKNHHRVGHHRESKKGGGGILPSKEAQREGAKKQHGGKKHLRERELKAASK